MVAKTKKKTNKKLQYSGTITIIAISVLTLLAYFLIPSLTRWLDGVLEGWHGLVYLLGAAMALEAYFLIIGYRGTSLLYALLVIFVTFMCLWMYINFDLIWDSMVSTLGQWPTIFIVLLGAIGLWFVIKIFL